MLQSKIRDLLNQKEQIIIAIDGRCGAGKTTLAQKLSTEFECNVIHMDDFFLQPYQRTEERLNEPGGNIDYERFLSEVLTPLKDGTPFCYRPYVCSKGGFGEPIMVSPKRLTVIEGSYSCHPKFCETYDLCVFMDITPEEQIERIIKRNGKEAAKNFKEKWIPMEERYFKEFNIKELCEVK